MKEKALGPIWENAIDTELYVEEMELKTKFYLWEAAVANLANLIELAKTKRCVSERDIKRAESLIEARWAAYCKEQERMTRDCADEEEVTVSRLDGWISLPEPDEEE